MDRTARLHHLRRLHELRQVRALRKDPRRMTDEQVEEWLDAISKEVGDKAMALERHLRAEVREHGETMKRLDRAWRSWDWDALADIGLVKPDDLRFVHEMFKLHKVGSDRHTAFMDVIRKKRAGVEDAAWFKGEIEKALQTLQDACDIAEARMGGQGALADHNGTVAAARTKIRRSVSRDLDRISKSIR